MPRRVPIIQFLACALTFLNTPMRAQAPPIRAYTVAQGLAHDHVSHIYRDSRDFLWVCTDEGLSRFDGRRFVNYTMADGLPHIHVNDIIETRDGNYWVATDGGVTLFHPADPARKFVTYKPDGPPQALFTNSVVEEPDGAVLVGTAAGLYRLHHTAAGWQFEPIVFPAPAGLPEGSSVNALYRHPDGTLWMGTVSGLYRRDVHGNWSRFMPQDGLPHDFVDRVVGDPDGRVWICTRHGLARVASRLEPGKPAVDLTVTDANGLPHHDVRCVLFTPDGHRWIATAGGLVDWRPGPPSPSNFRVYSVADGLTDREVYVLVSGPDHNIWMGSRRGGLMCLSRRGFETFDETEGLALSGSDEVIETPSGQICVAAITDSRRPLRCLDASGRRFHVTFPGLPADVTATAPTTSQTTIVDHNGDWWISSLRGLFRFHGLESGRHNKDAPDLRLLPAAESRHLFEDNHHDLWISTQKDRSFGLVRRHSDTRLEDLPLPGLARERGVTSFAEAPDGQLWIGLARPGGLFRWRDGQFEAIDGAPAGTVQALFRDRNGRLWIATAESGLGRIDNPSGTRPVVRVYNRSQGLSSNEIWCLTEDRYGRIYAGTGRGVDRLDRQSERITHYSSADGLVSGDIRAARCDRTGNLWFLSNRGLSRLQLTEDIRQPALPARITAIRVAGVSHPVSELGEVRVPAAEFGWHRNSVQIDFSAIAFQSPDQLKYQFRLEGTAEGWSEPTSDSTVHYSNLAPGRYRFLVRAINSDGVMSPTPASFAFTISPPPWLRWWFQAGIAGMVLGLAYVGHRLRLERQLAMVRVRSGIATDLHDDIGASLSRIAVMTEVVKERVSAADRDSQRMLREIAETSRMLVDGMSDIVWSIDPRHDNLADVVARLRAFGSDVLEPGGIHWACEGPADALNQALSPNQRRQLYLIFKEAIHNIARHSHAQNVTLRIRVDGNRVWGEIRDDGRGVPSNPSQGLGLGSMRQRAQRLGGAFQIGAAPQGGTQATLDFPLSSRNA